MRASPHCRVGIDSALLRCGAVDYGDSVDVTRTRGRGASKRAWIWRAVWCSLPSRAVDTGAGEVSHAGVLMRHMALVAF